MSPISSRKSVPPSASSSGRAAPRRAGERAPLVAEELRLDHRLGDRRRSWSRRTAAARGETAWQRARDQLLAGARLAEHEHVRRRGRDALDALAQPLHRVARADQRLRRRAAARGRSRAAQQARGRRPLEHVGELVLVERLGEEVEGAAPHRVDRVCDVAVRREQDHRQLGLLACSVVEQLRSLALRHAQVGDDGGVVRRAARRASPALPSAASSTA
jgi:hypothetical protein